MRFDGALTALGTMGSEIPRKSQKLMEKPRAKAIRLDRTYPALWRGELPLSAFYPRM